MRQCYYLFIITSFMLALASVIAMSIYMIVQAAKAGKPTDSTTTISSSLQAQDHYLKIDTQSASLQADQTNPDSGKYKATCINNDKTLAVMVSIAESSNKPDPSHLGGNPRRIYQDGNYALIPKCSMVYNDWGNPFCHDSNEYATNYNHLDKIVIQCAPLSLPWENQGTHT
jgi:hypothetical protein